MIWAVIPAAGRGARFGGDVPKQYLEIAGQPLLAHALDALLAHPQVTGAMVALAAGDTHWPDWSERMGKPVLTCVGGGERADSVLAALCALPAEVDAQSLVLVHDAARPNLRQGDISQLIAVAAGVADGAILAMPIRDSIKSLADDGTAVGIPRKRMWRALTPQAFRLGLLIQALQDARECEVVVTDEAMAMERLDRYAHVVEGRPDNIKVTTPSDLALAEFLMGIE